MRITQRWIILAVLLLGVLRGPLGKPSVLHMGKFGHCLNIGPFPPSAGWLQPILQLREAITNKSGPGDLSKCADSRTSTKLKKIQKKQSFCLLFGNLCGNLCGSFVSVFMVIFIVVNVFVIFIIIIISIIRQEVLILHLSESRGWHEQRAKQN